MPFHPELTKHIKDNHFSRTYPERFAPSIPLQRFPDPFKQPGHGTDRLSHSMHPPVHVVARQGLWHAQLLHRHEPLIRRLNLEYTPFQQLEILQFSQALFCVLQLLLKLVESVVFGTALLRLLDEVFEVRLDSLGSRVDAEV